MREDLSRLDCLSGGGGDATTWRNFPKPPKSLIDFVKDIRKHLLNRTYTPEAPKPKYEKLRHRIFMGMNPKKIHEVENFARYMDKLASDMATRTEKQITHLVDFGAGQNYLGRALANQPYNRHIVAIESRTHVVEGAKRIDVHAKLVEKPILMRNKKTYRSSSEAQSRGSVHDSLLSLNGTVLPDESKTAGESLRTAAADQGAAQTKFEIPKDGRGSVQYVEHRIKDGDLTAVINQIVDPALSSPEQTQDSPVKEAKAEEPALMVMSLHSCGNLVHHGLRSLTMNPSVQAVALVGCCYNLMTERLGPPSNKKRLRPNHPRLDTISSHRDPNGFPMSQRFATYKHRVLSQPYHPQYMNDLPDTRFDYEEGIRLNITARMMAVQAPQNWTQAESNSFFTRHFFRAVLQRIFLDKGVVQPLPKAQEDDQGCSPAGSSWGVVNGDGSGTAPVVIGNLKKKCLQSFVTYVRGAVEKLSASGGEVADVVQAKVAVMSDEEIEVYEKRYRDRKKELSIVWSLMAFAAGVVEAMIVIDRWLWLKEQDCVREAWVQPVFDYGLSPRNLVVVGIKK